MIWNPGQLPERWTLDRLMGKHPSNPFNPLLASAFFRAGYVESWGRGIEKMLRECSGRGMPAPVFDASMSGLMLTFKANPAHLAAALESTAAEGVTTTQETTRGRILALLRTSVPRHPRLSCPPGCREYGAAEDHPAARFSGASADYLRSKKIVNQFLRGTRFIVSVHVKIIHQLHIFIRLRQKTEANKLFRTRGNETTQVVLKPG